MPGEAVGKPTLEKATGDTTHTRLRGLYLDRTREHLVRSHHTDFWPIFAIALQIYFCRVVEQQNLFDPYENTILARGAAPVLIDVGPEV